jgi:hypothetical protein
MPEDLRLLQSNIKEMLNSEIFLKDSRVSFKIKRQLCL